MNNFSPVHCISFLAIWLMLTGCDNKVEDVQSEESFLRLKQIAEQFNAKIASKDIEAFSYTADFQDYFSDPKQHYVFDVWADDVLKQSDTMIGKFITKSDVLLFLNMNQEMLQTIKSEKTWDAFIVVVTIDRVYKPFFGLTGNVEDFEIGYAETDYGDGEPIIDGSFYIEVVDAPVVMYGKCVFIECQK